MAADSLRRWRGTWRTPHTLTLRGGAQLGIDLRGALDAASADAASRLSRRGSTNCLLWGGGSNSRNCMSALWYEALESPSGRADRLNLPNWNVKCGYALRALSAGPAASFGIEAPQRQNQIGLFEPVLPHSPRRPTQDQRRRPLPSRLPYAQ